MKSILPILLLVACTEPALDLEESTQDLEGFNGENLNGENLNGENLNGENLNGQGINGENLNGPRAGSFTIWTSLDGVVLDGGPLDSATLGATVFSGMRGTTLYSGTDFIGAQFQAMRGNGHAVTLRISGLTPAQAPATKWGYYIDFLEDNGNWYPICMNQSGPLRAYPLDGTWDFHWGTVGGGSHTDDPTRFTFACEKTGSLGKCVDDGYEPWSTTADGESLAAHHQACVRLLRADFCGDGTSYTKTGKMLNLYDGIGIQEDTNAWQIEAEWDENGARCFTSRNRASVAVPCYDAAAAATCGAVSHFDSGTLIMDELP